MQSTSLDMPAPKDVALLYGATEPALWHKTIGQLIRERAEQYASRTAVVVSWQSFRSTYAELAERSRRVAKALLGHGLRHGDCVGVMAGNRYEYIDMFLGAASIGCPVVLLNNTYSPAELLNASVQSSCKIVFIATSIGHVSLVKHIECLHAARHQNMNRTQVVCLDRPPMTGDSSPAQYQEFLDEGDIKGTHEQLEVAERRVKPTDVINLQFTSGTTGAPKAAMLTSLNLINNARFVGEGIGVHSSDVLCCPPPLFHCFGMVLGVLMAFAHGISIVLPSDAFNATQTLDAIHAEKATILHGVPTMFLAELQVVVKTGRKPTSLRTCFGAGSTVTMSLVKQLNEDMGVQDVLIGYGMTETSPISFMTLPTDTMQKKLTTIGRLIPHVGAKVIGAQGNILSRGQRGELCTTGFGLQTGYLNNPEKTSEVMKADQDGTIWMHTGDEVLIDDEGYGHITGRIKDMIIRGGENIFPGEIEERLLEHDAIIEASVVGINDARYGEVVGAFLRLAAGQGSAVSDDEVRQWVAQKLARQKAPKYVFWVGDGGHVPEFPKTGSGKYQKVHLREMGNKIVAQQPVKARL